MSIDNQLGQEIFFFLVSQAHPHQFLAAGRFFFLITIAILINAPKINNYESWVAHY